MKIIKYIFVLVAITSLFIGCSDKEEKQEKQSSNQNLEGKDILKSIEIVENKNYKQNKVALKEKDENESKVFYYDYNDEGKKKEKVAEEKNYTPVGAALNIRSPYEHVEISLLVSKLSKDFIVKCSACHDDYANGIIGPSLLSKDNEYIYNTIMDYKNGLKENVLMHHLVKKMSATQIKALADEIYTFNQEIKKIKARKQ